MPANDSSRINLRASPEAKAMIERAARSATGFATPSLTFRAKP